MKSGWWFETIRSETCWTSWRQSRKMKQAHWGRGSNRGSRSRRRTGKRSTISSYFGICRLIQKYTNFMKDLENHHTQELIRFEKAVKIQCKMWGLLSYCVFFEGHEHVQGFADCPQQKLILIFPFAHLFVHRLPFLYFIIYSIYTYTHHQIIMDKGYHQPQEPELQPLSP